MRIKQKGITQKGITLPYRQAYLPARGTTTMAIPKTHFKNCIQKSQIPDSQSFFKLQINRESAIEAAIGMTNAHNLNMSPEETSENLDRHRSLEELGDQAA